MKSLQLTLCRRSWAMSGAQVAVLLLALVAGPSVAGAAQAAAAAGSGRVAAKEAAAATGRGRLQAALASIDSEVSAATLRALGGDAAASALAAIVVDPRAPGAVRMRAAASLHVLADRDALRAGLALARSERLEPRLRWHLGYGAIVLGGRIDVPAALGLAQRWLAHRDPLLRDAAVHGLGHVPGPTALRLLRRAGSDSDAEVRAVALRLSKQRAGASAGTR